MDYKYTYVLPSLFFIFLTCIIISGFYLDYKYKNRILDIIEKGKITKEQYEFIKDRK